MREYGIIKQETMQDADERYLGDLIALAIPNLMREPGHDTVFEVLPVEWEAGYYSATGGTVTSSDDYIHCLYDASDFDAVLIPYCKKDTTSSYSGMTSGSGQTINPRYIVSTPTGFTGWVSGYVYMPVSESYSYVAASISSGVVMPVIGIRFQSD